MQQCRFLTIVIQATHAQLQITHSVNIYCDQSDRRWGGAIVDQPRMPDRGIGRIPVAGCYHLVIGGCRSHDHAR